MTPARRVHRTLADGAGASAATDPPGPEPASAAPASETPEREECTALDGIAPPMFSKPLREMTLAEALTPPPPGPVATIRPAAMMGGQFLPGAIARRTAQTATLIPIVHPGPSTPRTALPAVEETASTSCGVGT